MSGRIQRWLRRLPVVPVAWSIAVRVWWSTRVRPCPLPSLLQRLSRPTLAKRPVEDAVAVVYRTVPGVGRERCLPRSLILYGLLHRMGHPNCSFCLGVQPERFRHDASTRAADSPQADLSSATTTTLRSERQLSAFGTESWAHAWVEVNGEPLAEPTDPRVTHRVLYRHSAHPVRASAATPE